MQKTSLYPSKPRNEFIVVKVKFAALLCSVFLFVLVFALISNPLII
jgi:hypothetical protein